MTITKKNVVDKLAAYLGHELSLVELVAWAEHSVADGVFEEGDAKVLSAVIGRLGVADVRAFGLTWDDCEAMLQQLGYSARVAIVTA
jgi:hypothetical protein